MTNENNKSPRHPLAQAKEMIDELKNYFIEEPNPFALDLEKCQGVKLHTLEGETIYDWCAIYASRLLGFNHPRMFETDYVNKLVFAANNKLSNPYYLTTESLAYFKLVHELRPKCMQGGDVEVRVMTTNSGAEAVENMMKYLLTLHRNRLLEEKKSVNCKRFIFLDEAFHGRTGFAINITETGHDPIITRDYHGIISSNLVVPFPALDNALSHEKNMAIVERSLEHLDFTLKHYGDEIVGVIIEPLQGSGGQRLALPEFYQRLSELCHKYKVYFGIDEVQTAGGQTGAVFAMDLFNLPHSPTVIATAKKFGSGVVYMSKQLPEAGALDSTWCGSYVDMVRFNQEWKIVREEKLLEKVAEKSNYFVEKLSKLQYQHPSIISNIRGLGLYQGFSLPSGSVKAAVVDLALQKENLFLFPAGSRSLRFRPPLDICHDDIDILIERLGRVLYSL